MKAFVSTLLVKPALRTSTFTALFLGLVAMAPASAQEPERARMEGLLKTISANRTPLEHSERAALTTGTELLSDAGFEGGFYGGSEYGTSGVSGPWTWSNSPIFLNPIWTDPPTHTGSPTPRTGAWCVYFGPIGPENTSLSQTVSIPSGVTATLSFWLSVGTFEQTSFPEDTLKMSVMDISGSVQPVSHTYSNVDANAGFHYVQHSFDVSAFAGKTVKLQFYTNIWVNNVTIFLLDDVSILASAAGPPPTTLNLSKGRVEVSVDWKSQYDTTKSTNTAAFSILENDNFAFFYFTDASNPEVFMKVLDFGGTGPLCFVGSLTDYYVKVTFKILRTGQTLVFEKKAGDYVGFVDTTTLKF